MFFAVVFCAALLLWGDEALARAGGGGGSGSGGAFSSGRGDGMWFWALVLLCGGMSIPYGFILRKKIVQKKEEAAKAHLKAVERDKAWNEEGIRKDIQNAYFLVQEAWTKGDQKICFDVVTNRLYLKHQAQTDEMASRGLRNILQYISLHGVTIVEVADYPDDVHDSMWVVIEGSMEDYTIRTFDGKIESGQRDRIRHFTELWKLVRNPSGIGSTWLVDEIVPHVTWRNINGLLSYVHA